MRLFELALVGLLFPCVVNAEPVSPAFQVGQLTRVFHPREPRNWRGAKTEALLTLIWYPTEIGQAAQANNIGRPGHALFIGHPLVPGASIAAGRHPLILLSHGTGGSAGSLDWLGAALAERGYLVVGVNHPGNNALEPLTRAGFRLWWERALDVSDALDAVLADPRIGSYIDRRRIGTAGFSLGGYTALEPVGARTDVAAFYRFCRSADADAVCHPPEAAAMEPSLFGDGATDFSAADKASYDRSAASFRDARIRAAFVLAPALGEAFDAAGLASIQTPVALVAGDGDLTVPVATNTRRYANLMPRATIAILPGGVSHYTFVDLCAPAAMDENTAICHDAIGVDRAAIHQQIAERAARFFAETLTNQDNPPAARLH